MRRKMMKMKIIASAEGIIYRVSQKAWNLIDILIIVFVVQDVFSCVPLYYTNYYQQLPFMGFPNCYLH